MAVNGAEEASKGRWDSERLMSFTIWLIPLSAKESEALSTNSPKIDGQALRSASSRLIMPHRSQATGERCLCGSR
jgi:hypothetical protein